MNSELGAVLQRNNFLLYENSVRDIGEGIRIFIARDGEKKLLGAARKPPEKAFTSPVAEFEGVGLYELIWNNYVVLKKLMNIRPSRCDKAASFGTGDRLGLVTAAHLGALSRCQVFPVVAQQSPRELVRTRRSFKSVLLDAVMGVLESGYSGSYGADADHIKDEEYLREAAEAGYSMYTLDVSDWLRDISGLSESQLADEKTKLSPLSRGIISEYAGKKIVTKGKGDYIFSEDELLKSALVYTKAMEQICRFDKTIKEYLKEFDLEVSIDEGSRDTTPEDHLFTAAYLKTAGVEFKSLAPKFPGEFQKGVEYMGDTDSLQHSMRIHAAICDWLGGYRISLHSGSDKFSVYPLLCEVTGGSFHIKTSGTSWLEAVRVIASTNLPLLEKMYRLCLDNLLESKKAYHVYITPDLFPERLPSGNAMELLDRRDVRQLFHISYGVLLDNLQSEIFDTLKENEEKHYKFVSDHMDRHLKLLF